MLSVGKIAAGPAAARYYTDQVAGGRDDYYAGEGERPATWTGTGAAALGLSGEVDSRSFEDLLAGAGVRRVPREGAIAGFDLTFRAPKSVSVLWGIGGPELTREVAAGHDVAVAEALGYMEREACRARRGAGGVTQVVGEGFAAAAFRHRASRAGDPLLHTHVVVGNLTCGPDGRWTALDARHLYRHAKTAGYLYQAVLRRELMQRLGLEWTPVERGVANVRGVPRAVVEHFSRRRAQILEHMAAHHGRSAASAQIAALDTRRAKQDVPVDRLRELWRSRAAEHGLDQEAVQRLFAQGRHVPAPARVAPERLTVEQSTFGRPELLQALAQAQACGAGVRELEGLADATLTDREVIALREGPAPAGLSEPRFTTVDLLRIEGELLDYAEQSRDAHLGMVWRPALIDEALEGRGLSAQQEAVVRHLCWSSEGVSVVRAAAGTGKTYTLDAAREAWQAGGIDVLGCALSARAALELQDQAGINSTTIASLKHSLEEGHELPRRGVLVVDEAGMVGTRDLAELAGAAERADAKLVLVGDDRQLPEIQAGGAFHALAEREGCCELSEVRRQREAWDRHALDALRRGEVERWARAYRDRGRITVAPSAGAARAALVNDWARAEGEDKLMIAARRDDVRDLNQRARALLQADGRIGPDELEAGDRTFARGERVVAIRNDRHVGVLNGQRGTIRAIDRERRSVEVELDGGKHVTLPDSYVREGQLDHGYAITAHRAQGATVEHTFVLGSEELYQEWGYTALSRHREEARFYIARSDIDHGLDRDLPGDRDELIDGIGRLMRRSHAKQLALDLLTDADRGDLEHEHARLREQLQDDPAPRRDITLEERLAHAARLREDTEQRLGLLGEQRKGLRWYQRRERAELDRRLHLTQEVLERHSEQHHQLRLEHENAQALDQSWLLEHEPDAEQLLDLDEELRARDHADTRAQRNLEQLDQQPDRLAPPIEIPPPEIELDWDMGP